MNMICIRRWISRLCNLLILAGLLLVQSGLTASVEAMTVQQTHAQNGSAGPSSAGMASSDVSLAWAKRVGGTGFEESYSNALDADKNIYLIGLYQHTVDFDPGYGIHKLTSLGDTSAYVSKLDQNGNYVWAKSISGTGNADGRAIALDQDGNIYISGHFQGTIDFDPGPGRLDVTSTGSWDLYVSKLDHHGDLVWIRTMGGSGMADPWSISIDASGNIYTVGSFMDTVDFDPGEGTFNLTSAGARDVFISKLDASGSFVWAQGSGRWGDDDCFDIAVDPAGNIYTTGYFTSGIFISKLDGNGNFVWEKWFGGSGEGVGYGISLDPGGNVYISGLFSGTMDFDPGEGILNLSSNGHEDIFVARLDDSGNLIWAKDIGGAATDYSMAVLVAPDDNVYITGTFESTVDFDPNEGTYNLTSAGGWDVFVTRLDGNGNFVWAKSVGGPGFDYAMFGISIDLSSNLYLTGSFYGTADFDPGSAKFDLTSAGQKDIFISKLSPYTFSDVPASHPYFQEIEILYANGLTAGCQASPFKFCPDQVMNRTQAAVFMLRGNFGPGYVPDPPLHIFQDDWAKGPWAEPWAESMMNNGFSAGCLTNPPKYCPWTQLPREQVVIFALRLKYGKDYIPPPATGNLFIDMTDPGYYATAWAEQAYMEGIIRSCGTCCCCRPKFCPKDLVSRGLAAFMVVRAKNLTMP